MQTIRVDLLPAGSLLNGIPECGETRLTIRGRNVRGRQTCTSPGLSDGKIFRQAEGVPYVLLDLPYDGVSVIGSLSTGQHSNAGKPGRKMKISDR